MATLAGCLGKAGSIISPEDAAAIAQAHDFLVREEGYRRRDAAIEAVQSVLDSAQQHINELTGQVAGPTIAAQGLSKTGTFEAANTFQAPADSAELGQAAKDHVLSVGQQTGKENILVIGADGRVLKEGIGVKNEVVVPNSSGLQSPDANLAVHHNHPINTSLSDADIALLGQSGMDVIYAHTPDGHSFRASLKSAVKEQIITLNNTAAQAIGRRGLDESQRILGRASTAMARRFLPMLRELIRGKDISRQDAIELYAHATNLAWERAGVIDYDTSRDYADMRVTDAGVELISDAITDMANAARRSLERSSIDVPRLSDDRRAEPDIRHIADVGGIPSAGERPAGGSSAEGRPDGEGAGDDQLSAAGGPNLKQPGLRYIKNPLELGVSLPKGQKKRKIVDIGRAFDAAHMKAHGRKFYPESSEEDYQILLTDISQELENQRQRENSGEGWYTKDVLKALEMASQVYPTLAAWPSNQGVPLHRDVFLTFAGIFSNGNTPEAAFLLASEAFEGFLALGEKIPVKRSVAARARKVRPQRSQYKKAGEDIDALTGWTNRNNINEQQLGTVRWVVNREGSLQKGMDWLQSFHPRSEINRAMTESGLYKEGRYTTKRAVAGEDVPGFMVFGEKLGRYTLTLQGVELEEEEAAVIDLWYIRTYRRLLGRLLEPPLGDQGVVATPTENDRSVVLRMTAELGRRYNMRAKDIQAVLWFYEKRLWQSLGIDTSEGTNSSGALLLLESKGIPAPAGARPGDDQQGGNESGAAGPVQGPSGGRVQAKGQKGPVIRSTDVEELLGPAPPFYSAVTKAIEDSPMKLGTPVQWMNRLRNTQDVKKEEIDLLGLQEFLANPPPAFGPAPTGSLQSRGYTLERLPDDEGYPNPTGEMAWVVYGPKAPPGQKWDPYDDVPVLEELNGRTEEEAWANAQQIIDNDFENVPDAPLIKGKVSKQAILDFVRENEITVNEVEKGGAESSEGLQLRARNLAREQNQLLMAQARIGRQGLSPAAAENLHNSITKRLDEIAQEYRKIDELMAGSRDREVMHPGHVQPGGKNYKELLLTLPYKAGSNREGYEDPNHWAESDVLGWARFDEREVDGQRVMYVHEVQSQWHQQGREQGYRTPGRGENDINDDITSVMRELEEREPDLNKNAVSYDYWAKYWGKYPEMKQRYDALIKELGDARRKVPDAPFKQTWPELVMKRLIRYAAENGYDRIAWTPSDVQNERWSLAKHVNQIGVVKIERGQGVEGRKWWLYKTAPGGQSNALGSMTTKMDGEITSANQLFGTELVGKNIREVIGKEVAEKGLAPFDGREITLKDQDLTLGGKGMREFYDKRLVDIANKIGRRVGVEVGPIDIPMPRGGTSIRELEPFTTTLEGGGGFLGVGPRTFGVGRRDRRNTPEFLVEGGFRTIGEAERRASQLNAEAVKDKTPTQKTASLPITPSLREMAMEKGFPRFMWTSPAGRAKAAAQFEAAGVQLDQLAQQILGHRINLEVFTKAWKDAPYAMAAFFSNRHGSDKPVIAINLASTPGEHRPGALRHEAVHALRDWGVFTKPEWSILVRAAKRAMPMEILRQDYAYYRDEAANLTEKRFTEMVEEEAVAELFRSYGNGAFPSDSTIPVVRIIEKVGQFITKMVDLILNVLQSRNAIDLRDALTTFEDAPQIMARIEAGGFKDRPTGFRERPAEIRAKKGSKVSVGEMKKGGQAVPRAMQGQAPASEDQLDERLAGNINLDYLNTDTDIDSILVAIADIHDKFLGARRGVQSHANTARLAESMGLTEEQLLKRKRGEAWNAHRIYAARTLLVASARDLKAKIAQALRTESIEDLAKFQQAYTRHVAVQEQIAGLASEAGRALNQFKMMAGDFEFKAAKNLIDTALLTKAGGGITGKDALLKLLEMASQAPNDTALNTFTRKAYKATFWDKIREFYINMLLSGPQTHLVNFVSNLATGYLQIPEATFAATIGSARRIAGDKGPRVTWGEVAARFAGLHQGYLEGALAAGQVIKTGESQRSKERYVDQPQRKSIGGKAGKVIRIPTGLLAASDELFKAVNYHAELNAIIYRQAAVEEGLRGSALQQRIAELKADPPDDLMEKATSFSDYQTFQNKLGWAAQYVMRGREQFGLWLVLPFLKTPVNLFKYMQERTPGASLAHGQARRDLLGKNGKIAQDNAIAKLMTGSGMILSILALAGAGLLTGGGSDDPEEKERDLADGWQPYSFRFPGSNQWYSYQRGDPFAMLAGIVTDLKEQNYKLTETEWEKMPAVLIRAALNVVMSKTWARGPADLLEALGSRTEADMDRYIRSLVSSPIPTLMSQIARTQDPVLRDARTFMDSIMNRTPGQKQKLPARRDIWGEEKRYQQIESGLGSWADFMLNMSNPIYLSTMKRDPLIQMMREIGYAPSRPGKEINGHELTAEQYSEFSQLIGNRAKDMATRRAASLKPIRTREERFRDIWTDARKFSVNQMKRRYPEMQRPPKLPDVELSVVPEWSTAE